MIPSKEKAYLTPVEVAERLLVSPITVRSWAQKGRLRAEVTPGGHRRFLASEVERFAAERSTQARQAGTRGNVARILIVDDDRPLANFLGELLGGMDPAPEVAMAHDGFDAGRLLLAFEPDVVLLDLMMPGMDGFEVCRRIKSDIETRDLRVIAMTGHPSPENVKRVLAAGAEVCLHKPVGADELLRVIGVAATPARL